MSSRALADIVDRLAHRLREQGPFDGVLLELHGAMVAEGALDPEEEIVAVVREAVAGAPVAAVLDMHANMGRPRLADVDVLVGYRTNPHVDTFERGVDAARHLARVLRSDLVPYRAHRGLPMLLPPVVQRTDAPPLADVLTRARELEREHGLVDVTVHVGYAYSDVPHLGMGISVTAGSGGAREAQQVAEELAGTLAQRRAQFRADLATEEAALQAAAREPGLVALTDTGDNINGGAPGDGTWLLRAALSGPPLRVLASVCDPDAVQLAHAHGSGSRVRVDLGGWSSPLAGGPLEVEALVVTVGDGTFTNTGPMATGATVSMGRAAVLRVQGCDVVVQEHPVQPNDPELFRCLGLEPAGYDAVLLKGAAAVRAGWQELVSRFVDVASRGVCDSRLQRLHYRHAAGERWPFTTSEGGDGATRVSS